jgi:aminodeoxyfutalosine synthase
MTVSGAEIEQLAASHDIINLGILADELRQARHGLRTTFVRVADIGASPGSPPSVPSAAGEVRIVGVATSREAAVERVREAVAAAQGRPVSGFSLADLEQLALREATPLRALLEELRSAGLEAVADAPFDQLQDARRSIEEVNISGLALPRLTVHQSPGGPLTSFLRQVAALQRDVAVVRAFAPLPRTMNPSAPTTGYDDIRQVALARLVVENVPSIQVDWSLYGPKLAQVALTVGADDLDAVSPLDDAPEGRRRSPLEEVCRNIRDAGQQPVERDGRFVVAAR